MKCKIYICGTNSIFEYLRDQTFNAEIIFMGGEDIFANIHLIKLSDRNLVFDLKNTKILDSVFLEGILEDEGKVGRVAIQLS